MLVVQINGLIQKYTPKTYSITPANTVKIPVKAGIFEISKTVSDAIVNLQQGLLNAQKEVRPLNKNSYYCDYFGVNSAKNVVRRLHNQMALTWLKTREQNLENFPQIIFPNNQPSTYLEKSLNRLKEKKYGRVTVTDKLFGKNGKGGTHTIGIVYHKGKYIILDSIPETNKGIREYHENLIKELGVKRDKVLFSNKPQQSMKEYTCNNWTHANLDAVRNFLENKGKDKEITQEILDKILPEKIDNVLQEQYLYINHNLNGKSFIEVVQESHKNKRY